jgi:2,3-bisphosphoglycerate-dependent phosphoglycerate mutase
MIKVVFLRHGQSTWNVENRFTGWTDVDLSPQGVREAEDAGKMLRNAGYQFDLAYTSLLKRAIRTLWLVQETMDLEWLPLEKDWRLNERHYGTLQGLNKLEVGEHYGAEQLHLWRRGFAVRPPALAESDPRHPRYDRRYEWLPMRLLPGTESLEDTMKRAVEHWQSEVVPKMREGKKVLIVAHGNTLRALIKQLEGISDREIMELNIPTGIPLVYEFDDDFRVMAHYYLADEEQVQAAIQGVAKQSVA